MRDITKFPHAMGRSIRRRRETVCPDLAFARAMVEASNVFVDKHDRLPDYDIVRFRGAVSTTDVVVELWEEE